MISISITTYNRPELTMESFSKVIDHPLIDEIVIVDDRSTPENYRKLMGLIQRHPAEEKIKLTRNSENLGMSLNKKEAVSKAKNEWVVLLDSDNVIDETYVSSITEDILDPRTIYTPSFAKPDFDFREFEGMFINKHNAKDFLKNKMFRCFLNCCNYLVNREKYLEVYRYDPNIKEADTIHFNTLWLQAGYSFYFVPGMTYFHRKHEGSGWLQNHKQNIEDANRLQRIIEGL